MIDRKTMRLDTETARMMLNADATPEYPGEPMSKPSDPTPLYWRTALALGYTPGRHGDPPTRLEQHILALEPGTYQYGDNIVAIPARPLSYRARATDPDTSRSPAPPRALTGQVYQRILNLFAVFGPMTDEALYVGWSERLPETPISPSGLRSRRAELVKAGKLEDSGERGRTVSGRPCIIWRLT